VRKKRKKDKKKKSSSKRFFKEKDLIGKGHKRGMFVKMSDRDYKVENDGKYRKFRKIKTIPKGKK